MTPDEAARGGNPGRDSASGCLFVAVPAILLALLTWFRGGRR